MHAAAYLSHSDVSRCIRAAQGSTRIVSVYKHLTKEGVFCDLHYACCVAIGREINDSFPTYHHM